MYPDYKETAIKSLMGEFIKLVGRQQGKILFGEDGLAALDGDDLSPVFLSTEDVISIAQLLYEMPKPSGWQERDLRNVYKLAAAAEQRESDDEDHLLHTMQRIMYECKDGDCGMLAATIDKEKETITVCLEEGFLDTPVIDWLGNVRVDIDGEVVSCRIMAATVFYSEEHEEWTLTFKAKRLSDDKEIELPSNALVAASKKDIADYILERARMDPCGDTPLEKIDSDHWVAPRRGLVDVDDIMVPTAISSFTSCNIITVEVGTTGSKGGDSGHGCRTYLRITDDASTDMSCRIDRDGCFHHIGQVEILLGGDTELDTFTRALRFAADVLEKQESGKLHIVVPKNLDCDNH